MNTIKKSKEEKDFEIISYLDNCFQDSNMKIIDYKTSNTRFNSKIKIEKENGEILECVINSNHPASFYLSRYDAIILYSNGNHIEIISPTKYYKKIRKFPEFTTLPVNRISFGECTITDYPNQDGIKISDIFNDINPRSFYKVIYPNKYFDRVPGYSRLLNALIDSGYVPITSPGKDKNNTYIHISNCGDKHTIRCKKRITNPISKEKGITYDSVALVNETGFKIWSFSDKVKTVTKKLFTYSPYDSWDGKEFPVIKSKSSNIVKKARNEKLTKVIKKMEENIIKTTTQVNINNNHINDIALIDDSGRLNGDIILNTIEKTPLMVHHNGDKNKPVVSIKLVVNHQ